MQLKEINSASDQDNTTQALRSPAVPLNARIGLSTSMLSVTLLPPEGFGVELLAASLLSGSLVRAEHLRCCANQGRSTCWVN